MSINSDDLRIHERYMHQCIDLARKGNGKTSPNPMVGALVLDKYSSIVGKGYHPQYGEPHAEVFALDEAGQEAEGGTLYVSLEPCFHYGKTPPCVDRVLKSGVAKVIIAMVDPNSKVSGKSIDKLRQNGVEVVTGILEKEALHLNEAFCKKFMTSMPLITSKIAMTLDGKIATKTGSSKWITGEDSRAYVHHLRSCVDAVISGSSTVIHDNPQFTSRIQEGKDPLRIVIDSKLQTDPSFSIYTQDSTAKTILVTTEDNAKQAKLSYGDKTIIFPANVTKEGFINLQSAIKEISQEFNINSLMVEAGPRLNGALLKDGLIDKVLFFYAPKIVGDHDAYSALTGLNITDINNCITLSDIAFKAFGEDILLQGWIKENYNQFINLYEGIKRT